MALTVTCWSGKLPPMYKATPLPTITVKRCTGIVGHVREKIKVKVLDLKPVLGYGMDV